MSEPLIRRINREQMLWRAVDVEQLIGEDHAARAIWELVGRLRLDGFYEGIECSAEEGGRPAYDPRLLISLWIYAYSQGIGSAREVSRRSEWEPALQWLTGCEVVNYHTLASFRVEHRAELDELFTQVLGLMSAEGLITLEQVLTMATTAPAKIINRAPKIGTLQIGAPGDVSIMDLVEGPVTFVDTRNNKRDGKLLLKPVQTVINGVPFGRPYQSPFAVR